MKNKNKSNRFFWKDGDLKIKKKKSNDKQRAKHGKVSLS